MGRRTGYVRVDVNDLLSEVEDDDLLDEVSHRKLTIRGDGCDISAELADARREILRGRKAEAVAIIDRLLVPKWSSTEACHKDYRDFIVAGLLKVPY